VEGRLSFLFHFGGTYLKRTLRPAADDGLYEIMDAVALLALFDGCDKVFAATYEVVVSFF
jgi:hypothetical protein